MRLPNCSGEAPSEAPRLRTARVGDADGDDNHQQRRSRGFARCPGYRSETAGRLGAVREADGAPRGPGCRSAPQCRERSVVAAWVQCREPSGASRPILFSGGYRSRAQVEASQSAQSGPSKAVGGLDASSVLGIAAGVSRTPRRGADDPPPPRIHALIAAGRPKRCKHSRFGSRPVMSDKMIKTGVDVDGSTTETLDAPRRSVAKLVRDIRCLAAIDVSIGQSSGAMHGTGCRCR